MAIDVVDLLVNVRARVDQAERALQGLSRDVNKVGAAFGPVMKAAGLFGKAAAAGFGVLAFQAIAGGGVQAIGALGAALAPLAGFMAALPALGLAAAGAFAALKIGLLGVGAALKLAYGDAEAFEASLAGLAPSAQEFARAVRGTKEQFDALKTSVQDRLFQGMSEVVENLASGMSALIPGLTNIAAGMNAAAVETGLWLARTEQVAAIAAILTATGEAANAMSGSLKLVVEGLLALATGGTPAITDLAGGVTGLAESFRDWAVYARDAGSVMTWIDGAKTAAVAIGGALATVFSILGSIFSAAASAGSVLGGFGVMLERLDAYLKSDEGRAGLVQFFDAAAAAADALWPVIEQVIGVVTELAPVLADIAIGVAPALVAFFEALRPVIASLGPDATRLGEAFAEFVVSLIPLLPMLADMVGLFVTIIAAIAPFGPAILAVVTAAYGLGVIITIVGAVSGSLGVLRIAFTVLRGAWIATAATAVASAATLAWAWFTGTVVPAAAAVIAFVAARVVMVAGWLLMGVRAMASAVIMAAAWLVALGPVAIVIAVVVALVALIIANWDTIVNATRAAWEWIQGKITAAWDMIKAVVRTAVAAVVGWVTAAWEAVKTAFTTYVEVWRTIITTGWEAIKAVVTGAVTAVRSVIEAVFSAIKTAITTYVNAWRAVIDAAWSAIRTVVSTAVAGVQTAIAGLASIAGRVREWFGQAKDAASDKLSQLVAFVGGIPGRIVSGLGSLGSLLYNSGKSIIQGLINGIKDMAGNVSGAVKGVLDKARNLLPFSPAKEGPFSGKGWTLYSGRSIAEALAQGLTDRAGRVAQAALAVAGAAQEAFGEVQVVGPPSGPRGARDGARAITPEAARTSRDSSSTGPSFTFVTHNPVAEPQSVTTNKALARAGALALV